MLKVNGVARGQYKQLCPMSWGKCNGNEGLLAYKIRRAVDLGKETYTYSNGCKIIRYGALNFLVSRHEIMTVWVDNSRPVVVVADEEKALHKEIVFDRKFSPEKMMRIFKNNFEALTTQPF